MSKKGKRSKSNSFYFGTYPDRIQITSFNIHEHAERIIEHSPYHEWRVELLNKEARQRDMLD